jgi:hypothetical protein
LAKHYASEQCDLEELRVPSQSILVAKKKKKKEIGQVGAALSFLGGGGSALSKAHTQFT